MKRKMPEISTRNQPAESQRPALQPQPVPWWDRMLRKSFMQFNCPNLESEYQAHVAEQRWIYVFAFSIPFITAWVRAVATIGLVEALLLDLGLTELGPGVLPSMILFVLPLLALMAFIWARGKAYAKNWRLINAVIMTLLVLSHHPNHQVVLWNDAVLTTAKPPSAAPSPPSRFSLRSFANENHYFMFIYLRDFIFPTGLASDIAFNVLGLAVAMAGNKALCASSLFGAHPATTAPVARHVAQAGCTGLLSLMSAHNVFATCPASSCPAVMAFWQVLGCAVACLLVIVGEIISRRKFLRLAVVRLGPSLAGPAARWPLGSPKLVHNLICAVSAVVLASSVLMALALSAVL